MSTPTYDDSSDESDHGDFSDWMDDKEFYARCKNDVYWYAYRIVPGFGRSLKEAEERCLNHAPRPLAESGKCDR